MGGGDHAGAMPRKQLQTKSLGPRADGRHRRETHVKYGGTVEELGELKRLRHGRSPPGADTPVSRFARGGVRALRLPTSQDSRGGFRTTLLLFLRNIPRELHHSSARAPRCPGATRCSYGGVGSCARDLWTLNFLPIAPRSFTGGLLDRRRRGRHARTRRSRDGSVRGRGTPEVRHRRAPGVTGCSGGLYERRVSTGQTNGSEGRRKLFGMATRDGAEGPRLGFQDDEHRVRVDGDDVFAVGRNGFAPFVSVGVASGYAYELRRKKPGPWETSVALWTPRWTRAWS